MVRPVAAACRKERLCVQGTIAKTAQVLNADPHQAHAREAGVVAPL